MKLSVLGTFLLFFFCPGSFGGPFTPPQEVLHGSKDTQQTDFSELMHYAWAVALEIEHWKSSIISGTQCDV